MDKTDLIDKMFKGINEDALDKAVRRLGYDMQTKIVVMQICEDYAEGRAPISDVINKFNSRAENMPEQKTWGDKVNLIKDKLNIFTYLICIRKLEKAPKTDNLELVKLLQEITKEYMQIIIERGN